MKEMLKLYPNRKRLVFMLLAASVSAHLLFAQVSTTFDMDLEGWLVTGDNSAAWEANTGDPDGCLSVNDWATGARNYVIAPPAYHGDWSSMSSSDSISVGYYFQPASGSLSQSPYIFRIAGPGGAAHALDDTYPAQGTWTYYTVTLDPAEWVIESGDWNAILSAVYSVRLQGEFWVGHEICRVDNIHLTGTPQPVFLPCVYDDFNTAGTGDWSFLNTGGVSNPGSGGNSGGYLSISDGTGLSKALAPSMFRGNWSDLDGNGYVTIDLRMVSRSGTPFGSQEFIRISGPGGSAYVTLDPADLPQSNLIWKTFSFPLDTSIWTVDTGTWTGLLSEVAECLISLEFYSGTETVGFDNFGRLSNSCSAIDDTVTVIDPNVSKCGYYSLVGVYNMAHNPFDDELYGILRAGTATGGVYPVTGDAAGIRIHAYDRPAHLIFDKNGNAFISEDYGGGIYKLEYYGISSLWVTGFHSGDDDPFGMTFAPVGFNGPNVNEGDILVSDRGYSGSDEIWSFSPEVPEGERLVMPDPGNVDHFDLASEPNGLVYVSDAFDADHIYTLDPDGILSPIPLTLSIGNIYSIVYDNVENDIYIAGGSDNAIYRIEPSTGVATLMADGFKSLVPCCLEINPPGRRLWATDNGYNRVYEFCLVGGVAVDVTVSLEGFQRPDPSGWEIPLFIDFYLPGADVLNQPDVYHSRVMTVKSGNDAVGQVSGVAPGTYDVTAASEHTLLNVRRNVVIAEPKTTVNMGTLLEGNAYMDGAIDLYDVSVFAGAWLTDFGQTAYDQFSDFNRDDTVDIFDLNLLVSNWLKASPIEIP